MRGARLSQLEQDKRSHENPPRTKKTKTRRPVGPSFVGLGFSLSSVLFCSEFLIYETVVDCATDLLLRYWCFTYRTILVLP